MLALPLNAQPWRVTSCHGLTWACMTKDSVFSCLWELVPLHSGGQCWGTNAIHVLCGFRTTDSGSSYGSWRWWTGGWIYKCYQTLEHACGRTYRTSHGLPSPHRHAHLSVGPAGTVGQTVGWFLVLWGKAIMNSINTRIINIHINTMLRFSLFISSPVLVIICFLNSCHSD